MTKDEHKFLFSVIMPIYNVEDYIEEAILSLVNQTIGFDKIQLIMINDGSPDNSEAICLKYKEMYPDNIVYQKIPNGGVSNARNTAFQYVDAKYITFLDPDDKWELSSFENAYKFFEEHYDEIDVLAARIQFFEENDDLNIAMVHNYEYSKIVMKIKEYIVQNYKGTVYDKNRYDANVTNKEWYKTDVDTRYTDAIDNYNTREKIDDEIAEVTNKTATTIDKMDSTTPTMGISVEYTTTTTIEPTTDKFKSPDFKIENIDFGIVERARQDLALRKRVNTFKVTLANGQVIADMAIDEKGNITGERNHVTYMGPSSTTTPKNGLVKLELDNELIQGATVEVEYEIKVTNNSELDYVSEDFYKYGIKSGNEVTITPTSIIDYLDKNWGFEAEKNKEWTVKSLDEIKNIVAKEVYENEDSTIADKTILYTESLKDEKLKPTESAKVNLNVSKVLSNSDEISLDNESEITELTKDGGSKPISTPGNYIPGQEEAKESDESIAETVIVTPSTGANLEFIVPIMIGVIALVILGAGVVIIKKKTL